MKKIALITISFLLCLLCSNTSFSRTYEGKKVLFIDSYHEGYAWSDGITKGVEMKLKDTGVVLKIHRMDTKRHSDDAFKKQAAQQAVELIKEFKPDVVIAADDNASKFLIKPYYKDADLPFVFCGVNWDAKVYDYPYKNATGMIEVAPIPILLEQMELYAQGKRIGFIGPDIITAHKEAENYRKVFGLKMVEYYAKSFQDWKNGFKQLQDKVDMLIVDSDGGLYDEHGKEYEEFAMKNSKIPSGTVYDFMARVALIGVIKIAEEQGIWAADTALSILDGTPPSEIEIVENKRAKLFINKKMADSMGVDLSKFPRLR